MGIRSVISFEREMKLLGIYKPHRIQYNSNTKGSWVGSMDKTRCYINYIAKRYPNVYVNKNVIGIHIKDTFSGESKRCVKDTPLFGSEALCQRHLLLDNYTGKNRVKIKKDELLSAETLFGVKKKRFQVLLVTLYSNKRCHSNSLIIDHHTKEITLFEPQGTTNNTVYIKQIGTLKNLLKRIGYSVKKESVCRKLGLQNLDSRCDNSDYNYNSKGFCLAWSLFFIEVTISQRFTKGNVESSQTEMVKKVRKLIKQNHCEFIRAYSSNIDKIFQQNCVKN